MDKLFALLKTLAFEEFGSLLLLGASRAGNNLQLSVGLFTGEDTDTGLQHWTLTCHRALEHRVVLGGDYCWMDVHTEHVLLWPYHNIQQELSFSSPPGLAIDAAQVVGKLYEQHQQIMGVWRPFEKSVNSYSTLTDLIAGGFGKLAYGPAELIQAYRQVLEEAGFRTSVLPSGAWLRGDSNVAGKEERLSVLILGETYVIADDFTAVRVEASSSADAD